MVDKAGKKPKWQELMLIQQKGRGEGETLIVFCQISECALQV
jgi:hypothetical protein